MRSAALTTRPSCDHSTESTVLLLKVLLIVWALVVLVFIGGLIWLGGKLDPRDEGHP